MKTAGVFSGGGCRVTERCARWWNRQAGKDRNQSLHSPTHLTWLERLNWRARDCGCSSSRRCCCPGSLLHCSPAGLKWFSIEVFFFLLVFVLDAEKHALASVKVRFVFTDYLAAFDVFGWMFAWHGLCWVTRLIPIKSLIGVNIYHSLLSQLRRWEDRDFITKHMFKKAKACKISDMAHSSPLLPGLHHSSFHIYRYYNAKSVGSMRHPFKIDYMGITSHQGHQWVPGSLK